MSRPLLRWFLPLFALAASAPARAAEVALQYEVSADCPAAAEFEAALATRGASLAAPDGASRVLGLKLAIAPRDGEYFGKLRVERSEGASDEREVHAKECGEVVKGLAVVAAIALGAPSDPADSRAAAPAPSAKTRAPVPTPTPTAEANARPHLRATSFLREDEIEVAAGTLRIDRVRTYDLSAGASFNLVPGLVIPRYDFTMGVAHFITPPNGPSRLIGPIIDANWHWLGPGTIRKGFYDVEVHGLGAGVRSCSAVTHDSQGFVFDVCAEFGLAWLRLESKSFEDPSFPDGVLVEEKDTGLGTAGLGAALRYNFSQHLHVGLRAAGQLQLGGLEARRRDGTKLFQLPLLGAHAEAGIGLHF